MDTENTEYNDELAALIEMYQVEAQLPESESYVIGEYYEYF